MKKSEQSKELLSEALIILLKKKDYNKITIQNIVDKAGVSRMAFYRNFNDKDDIIKYYLDKITDEFVANTKIDFEKTPLKDYLIILFNHLITLKDLSICLSESKLFGYVKNEFDRIYLIKANNKKEEYNYYLLSGALSNLYYHYIINGCKESSEELTDIVIRFLNNKKNKIK